MISMIKLSGLSEVLGVDGMPLHSSISMCYDMVARVKESWAEMGRIAKGYHGYYKAMLHGKRQDWDYRRATQINLKVIKEDCDSW